ncbi:DUF3080 family protein [Reinekea blandensis]|uniref:DUF3080 domain-containing protein n=1 Tax=Reinekea blandensis MED297 TaxID=314283 RepID=A4BBP5_9GAMM|nr:DUF3080 family protein [Reinekea blandensis]EAR10380.1 hypothetical protein MED297_01125 [Reinekea sp. MED297] [Reinekea blandensis MED297]
MGQRKLNRQSVRRWRFTIVCGLCAFLISCNNANSLLDDYLSRLQRTLDVDIPSPETLTLPAFPPRRDLLIDIPDSRINLIEAWELNHCQVFSLIGERNSILGKLSEADVRFDYERRLLNALPDCIEDDATSDDTRELLTTVLITKRRQLKDALWNATFAQADFAHLFSLSERELKPDEPLNIALYEQVLSQLVHWPKGESAVSSEHVSHGVKLGSEFSLAGATLQSQRLAIIRLTQANQMLLQATDASSLCPKGLTLPELEFARNVMMKSFIGKVQPWLVTVADAERASLAQTYAFAQTFPTTEQGKLVSYFEDTRAINHRFREIIRLHTERWQALFETCQQSATPS